MTEDVLVDDTIVTGGRSYAGDRQAGARAVLTPNAIARTTGSVSVDVSPAGELGLVTTICVFEGTGSAAATAGPEAQVPEDHCVTISGASLGVVTPRPLPPGFRPIPKPSTIAAYRLLDRVPVYASGRNVEDSWKESR